MTWIQLSTHGTNEAIDWIRTLLASVDYIQHTQVESELASNHDSDQTREPSFNIQLYLLNDSHARTHVNQIIHKLASLERTGMITEIQTAIAEELPAPNSAALNRIGSFVILSAAPAQLTLEPDTIPLIIAPSAAFGSGLHPATILSLRLLERYVQPGIKALDVGCGSGILSVALTKLGATVTAMDNDPTAIAATQRAVQENHVADSVAVFSGSLGAGSELGNWMGGDLASDNTSLSPAADFDLIVANLFARIHIRLLPDYRRALRQRRDRPSLLITAGYDTDYEQEINQTFAEADFHLIDREQMGNWIALVHQLTDDTPNRG